MMDCAVLLRAIRIAVGMPRTTDTTTAMPVMMRVSMLACQKPRIPKAAKLTNVSSDIAAPAMA